MLRLPWMGHVNNDEVLRKIRTKRYLQSESDGCNLSERLRKESLENLNIVMARREEGNSAYING